jgi:hypothetical protein
MSIVVYRDTSYNLPVTERFLLAAHDDSCIGKYCTATVDKAGYFLLNTLNHNCLR